MTKRRVYHQVPSASGTRTHGVEYFGDGQYYDLTLCGIAVPEDKVRRARFEKASAQCGNCRVVFDKLFA